MYVCIMGNNRHWIGISELVEKVTADTLRLLSIGTYLSYMQIAIIFHAKFHAVFLYHDYKSIKFRKFPTQINFSCMWYGNVC